MTDARPVLRLVVGVGGGWATRDSTRLRTLSEELLAHLGRSWDDPPVPGEIDAQREELLRRFGRRGRGALESACDGRASPSGGSGGDPTGVTGASAPSSGPTDVTGASAPGSGPTDVTGASAPSGLLIPFWRAVLNDELTAVLAWRHPLEAARLLQDREGIGLATALALWERYLRLALEDLAGLPTVVTTPGRCDGADGQAPEDVLGPEPESPEQKMVLPEQLALVEVLSQLSGSHTSLEVPSLPPESPWTTATLGSRHEAYTIWRSCAALAPDLAAAIAPPPKHRSQASSEYPKNATDDESAYHEWLRQRGEPTTVGGPITIATPPPPAAEPPLFSIVVPTYDTAVWALDRCVASVLAQDSSSYELILVDDASSHAGMRDRLRKLASVDPRISVRFRKANGGISAATNDGVGRARGEWVAFLDHDDELVPYALSRIAAAVAAHPVARLLYSDEDKIDEVGRRHMPAFKPDWSPDLLLSNAYMCHLLAVRRDLLEELGGLRSEFDGAQDYDLMLRATELLGDDEIVHLPEVLYHWRAMSGSAAGDPSSKPWAFEAGRRAVEAAIERRGIAASAVESHPRIRGSYIVRRRVVGRPLVSAIIPFRDEPALLADCYRAFVAEPGHEDFELLLVDNDSALPETQAVLNELARDRRVRLIDAPGAFDWVKINNEAAGKARGDVLLFLNNDVEASSPGWLAEMVSHAQREEVGAVGARLLFPDGTIQHGGVAVGVCWGAAHVQQGLDGALPGYLSAVSVVRNTSAVTGACLMSRRDVFESVGGFDESLPVAFNDIDYCLRLRERRHLVIYTPFAELVHHESRTRGHTDDVAERPRFRSRWRDLMLGCDPYYNPNLGRFDHYCRFPHEEDEERWQIFLSMLNGSSTS